MLRRLETVIPPEPGRPEPEPSHPMRTVTRQIAFEPTGWTPERAGKVAALFDGMAADWHTRMSGSRMTAIEDALARGGPFPRGWCLELGSGVGLFTRTVAGALGDVVSADIAVEMLRHAPHDALRVQADGSRLPFADGSFATVVLVNMFLFPNEVDRVLRADGRLVWVNTHGPATPIHLSAQEVEAALPGEWDGVHAEAGWGTWAVLGRG